MNYITGEKLQEFTDHSIIFEGQINIRVAMIQLKNTNCEGTLFSPFGSILSLPEKIIKARSLFVYIYALDMFFNKVYPLLNAPFVLVTHNSDDEVNSKYEKYLNEGKIKRWYSQNINLDHPKLISVPIGIANSQWGVGEWKHGDIRLLDSIRNENILKTNLVYKNFDVKTSISRRLGVLESTQSIPLIRNRSQDQYLRDVASSKFNICPMGNGIDTHRMWESLYLGSIPIVQDCINNRQYQELPILMISDWESITPEFLEKKYEEISNKKYNYRKMDLEYWKDEITKE